jgi:hypothetical protein
MLSAMERAIASVAVARIVQLKTDAPCAFNSATLAQFRSSISWLIKQDLVGR